MIFTATVYVPQRLVMRSGHALDSRGYGTEVDKTLSGHIGYQMFEQVINRVGKIANFGHK